MQLKEKKKLASFISASLDERTKLEALAEALAELQQATFTLMRAKELNNNFTPVTVSKATETFNEKLVDFFICMDVLGVDVNDIINIAVRSTKWSRWARKLGFYNLEENNAQ